MTMEHPGGCGRKDTLEIHTSPSTYTAEDLAALWKSAKANYPELDWAPENQQPDPSGP